MMKRTAYPIRRGPRGGHDRDLFRDEPLPDLRPGAPIGVVVLTYYGRQYVLEFKVPGDTHQRRARSDQIAVEIDGEWRRMSLRSALLELDRMVPRLMTRRERDIY
jgi:hypothetical protein